jgi:phosphopantothenoylcysteine decarboxylase/phosphopantothenate--cysteine ligase
LKKKKLDFIVVNNPLIEGAGFGVDTNIVKIIDKDENVEDLPKLYKSELAKIIIDKVIKIINERK